MKADDPLALQAKAKIVKAATDALENAINLIAADIPGRILTSPSETPIGVVTAFFGATFFLFLLRMREARQ